MLRCTMFARVCHAHQPCGPALARAAQSTGERNGFCVLGEKDFYKASSGASAGCGGSAMRAHGWPIWRHALVTVTAV